MNDTYNKNREVFIAEAYKLIEAESTLDDFKKEIRNMQPKFGIIDLAKQPKSKDGMIAMGRFVGDEVSVKTNSGFCQTARYGKMQPSLTESVRELEECNGT